jgi:uridine phosphorylase
LVERNLAKVEVESSRLFSRSSFWKKRRQLILEMLFDFCDNDGLENAGVAQLVERNLAKVEVESSRLFSRSSFLDWLLVAVSSRMQDSNAGVAQLVERNLAKVEVESSRLFSRSSVSGLLVSSKCNIASGKMQDSNAGVAQLVERNLAKVEVESSRLFSRSRIQKGSIASFFCHPKRGGAASFWRGSKEVMQRPAKPFRRVRFPSSPPENHEPGCVTAGSIKQAASTTESERL